jgi:phosphoglycolate phosphatase-like HAD superfamily hydrolase
MARVSVNGRYFDIDAIAFDKDGTLLDFHHLWGQKAQLWVDALVARTDGSAAMRQTLFQTLGYEPASQRVVNDSPLVVASIPKLYTLAAAVLYQHGVAWHVAEGLVQTAVAETIEAIPSAQLVRPLGAVAAAVQSLHAAGVQIAVITSDDRRATLDELPALGIAEWVAAIVCGDDPLPNKPAPEGLYHAAQTLGVVPQRMLMVGDTASDMVFGRNAGVAGCIGVRGGAGDLAVLRQHADVVVGSIGEIEVVG